MKSESNGPIEGCLGHSRDEVSVNINSLNADIYRLMEQYLSAEEFRALLHVNKQVHGEYIEYRFISLNETFSGRYLHEEEGFRQELNVLIKNPGRQLGLKFERSIEDVSGLDGAAINSVKLFSSRKLTDVSALRGVHSLDLSGCSGITDVSALGGVHSLDLSCCYLA
jgi:hypothetical protein